MTRFTWSTHEYSRHGRSSAGEGKWIKGTRYSLLKDTAKQTTGQLLKLAEVRAVRRSVSFFN